MYFLLGFLSLRLSLCFWCFLVSLRSSGFAFTFLHFHIIVVLNLGILVLRQDWQFSCHLNNFQIFLFILFSGNSYSKYNFLTLSSISHNLLVIIPPLYLFLVFWIIFSYLSSTLSFYSYEFLLIYCVCVCFKKNLITLFHL